MSSLNKKILFVDLPFGEGGDAAKSRSAFLWEALHKHFEADLLLVKTPEYLTRKAPEPEGYDQIYFLVSSTSNPFKPRGIHQFSQENKVKFTQILLNKRYEMIFLCGESCLELALLAEKALPECSIALDIDKLLSKRELALWQQNPVWKNRIHQIEYLHLKQREKILFEKNFRFIFASGADRKTAMIKFTPEEIAEGSIVIPSPHPEASFPPEAIPLNDREEKLLKDKYILFYGDLATDENLDAFLRITKDIFPRISKKLQEKDIKIYIVGRNKLPIHERLSGGRIKLIGAVENLPAFINAGLFVIFPFRKAASGKRIMEAGLLQKAVLTTGKALADLEISFAYIAVEDRIDDYCSRLVKMLEHLTETDEMGKNLCRHINETFDRAKIERTLLAFLNNAVEKPCAARAGLLRIAVIIDAVNPEIDANADLVNGIVANLAGNCNVSLFLPGKKAESQPGFDERVKIFGLGDLSVLPLFKISNQICCPALFYHLLKQDFDVIHSFSSSPANNYMAFAAAKIKEIPLVLNALPAEATGRTAPESEKRGSHAPGREGVSWLRKQMLSNTDYLFAFTEKNYTFLKQFNDRVEQIPIPLTKAYDDRKALSLRVEYGIDADSFVLLCPGTLTYANGQDLAVKAFAKAITALDNVKLILAGDNSTDKDFAEDLEALIFREGLQEEALITGIPGKEEITAWIGASDLILVPARALDNNTIVLQSWALNKPILQSDAVDPNLVIEGFNGFLFCSQDINDLSLQMQKAFQNKTGLHQMAERGNALVKSKHKIDFITKRYLEAYKQLTLSQQ